MKDFKPSISWSWWKKWLNWKNQLGSNVSELHISMSLRVRGRLRGLSIRRWSSQCWKMGQVPPSCLPFRRDFSSSLLFSVVTARGTSWQKMTDTVQFSSSSKFPSVKIVRTKRDCRLRLTFGYLSLLLLPLPSRFWKNVFPPERIKKILRNDKWKSSKE